MNVGTMYKILCDCDDGFSITMAITNSTTCHELKNEICQLRNAQSVGKSLVKSEDLSIVTVNEIGEVDCLLGLDVSIVASLGSQGNIKVLGFTKYIQDHQDSIIIGDNSSWNIESQSKRRLTQNVAEVNDLHSDLQSKVQLVNKSSLYNSHTDLINEENSIMYKAESPSKLHSLQNHLFLHNQDENTHLASILEHQLTMENHHIHHQPSTSSESVQLLHVGKKRGRKPKPKPPRPIGSKDMTTTRTNMKRREEAMQRNVFIPDPVELAKLKAARSLPLSQEGSGDCDWEDKFDLLQEYYRLKGTCNVSKLVVVPQEGAEVRLGLWVYKQRQDKKKGTLRQDRLERLQALVDAGKFNWVLSATEMSAAVSTDDESWDRQFEAMLKYGEEHNGNCNVPETYTATLPCGTKIRLGYWLKDQRKYEQTGKMRKDRHARLQALVDAGKLKWSKKRDRLEQQPASLLLQSALSSQHNLSQNQNQNHNHLMHLHENLMQLQSSQQQQQQQQQQPQILAHPLTQPQHHHSMTIMQQPTDISNNTAHV